MKNKLFFPLSFNNVDIYYIELDSIKDENEFIYQLSQLDTVLSEIHNREYFILHLEESIISQKMLDDIILLITAYKVKMKRLGIVGVHGLLYLKTKKQMKAITSLDYFICNDLQKAKEIIVGAI